MFSSAGVAVVAFTETSYTVIEGDTVDVCIEVTSGTIFVETAVTAAVFRKLISPFSTYDKESNLPGHFKHFMPYTGHYILYLVMYMS